MSLSVDALVEVMRRTRFQSSGRRPQPFDWLTDIERAQCRRLVDQAWALRERGSPYLRDAIQALIAWWFTTEPDRHERRAEAALARYLLSLPPDADVPRYERQAPR